jgi:hypothetical protein
MSSSSESTESTQLAHGVINGSGDTINVMLIRPADIPTAERTRKPARVRIVWPAAPTVATPDQLNAVVTKATHILARAMVEMSHIRRDRLL